jgi:hypothetical protein
MRSPLRFSHAGTPEALALPALKRVIKVARGSFPRINAGAPTTNLDKSDASAVPTECVS